MQDIEKDLQQMQEVYTFIINFLIEYSFQLLGTLLVLVIGMLVAGKAGRAVANLCERRGIDVTLARFFGNIARVSLVVMVAVMCLNMLGISVTPLVAAIGAASLGVGLAVQGLLSNYGAGLNIILARPFVVGDTVRIHGVAGRVKDILLAHTILEDEDGVLITIPNKHIVGEIVQNSKALSLAELSVGVAYASDLDKVVGWLEDALGAHEWVQALQVGIGSFDDSCVTLEARCWVPTQHYNAARHRLNKLIWDTLRVHQVVIPFPQREVTLLQS